MRSSCWLTLVVPVLGINLGRSAGAPRVLSLDFKRSVSPSFDLSNARRDTAKATLDNSETLYFINVTIGTPPQSFSLQIDTGSSDLWVNTASSDLCSRSSDGCSVSGTYSARDSSTHQADGGSDDFNITYADGSGAAGPYARDTLRVAGQTVDDYKFGIGETSSSPQGVLGIGYVTNEAQSTSGGGGTYKNLPARLASDGVIASNAYSLWLNDLDASTGNVLFGGVDRAKFAGELVTIPIQESQGTTSAFFVELTSLKIGPDSISNGLPADVLLDSGSSLTYLPDEVVGPIYGDLGAIYERRQGIAYVPCSLRDNSGITLDFRFGDSVTISVPFSEIVLDPGNVQTGENKEADICVLGISPSGSGAGVSVLGDTFLRSAYVVYDLDNNEISLAQSSFNASGSDIVEIGSGADAVPSLTGTGTATGGTTSATGEGDDDGVAPMVQPPTRWTVVIAACCTLMGFVGFLA